METHIVEDEELGLGAEVGNVGDAREAKVALGTTRHAARVEPVALLRDGVNHVGDETQGLVRHERVYPVAVRVGHEEHVGLVNRGPAAQGRTVEAEPLFE
jgi:hypothetical protein